MKRYLILLIAGTLLLFISQYSGYDSGNHQQFLPNIYRMIEPGYLSEDWYTNTTEGYNVRLYANLLVIACFKIFGSMEAAFLILMLGATIMLSVSIFYLALYFYEDKKKAALLTLFCQATISTTFAGSAPMYTTGHLANALAYPISFIGLNLILRRRAVWGFLVLGIATLFQPVVSGISFGIWTMVHLYINRKKIEAKTLIAPFAWLIISLFNIVPILLYSTASVDSSIITYIYAKFRHPWHSLMSSWKISLYLASAILVAMAFQAAHQSRIKQKGVFYAIFWSGLAIFFSGYIFVEVIPIGIFAKAQIPRAFTWVMLFSYIMIFHAAYEDFVKGSIIRKVFLVALIFSLSHYLYRYLFILLGSIYLIDRSMREKIDIFEWKNLRWGLLGSFLILILTTGLLSEQVKDIVQWASQFFPGNIAFLTMIGGFLLYILVSIMITYQSLKKIAAIGTAALVISVLISVASGPQYPEDMLEICRYARQKTPEDSIFLTPPEGGWRLCLERAIVVDFKSIPFSDSHALEWYDRMMAVTNEQIERFDPEPRWHNANLNAKYETLRENTIHELKERYGIEYAIFGKNDFQFRILYSNERYTLYKIE